VFISRDVPNLNMDECYNVNQEYSVRELCFVEPVHAVCREYFAAGTATPNLDAATERLLYWESIRI